MGMVEFPIHPGDRVGDEVFTANDHGRPGRYLVFSGHNRGVFQLRALGVLCRP